MLLAKQLVREFILDDNGQRITLSDPESNWSVQAVLNFTQYLSNFDDRKSV